MAPEDAELTEARGYDDRTVLDLLRERYVADGYQFILYPPRELVPVFLGEHRPDAIALKDNSGVVIESRRGQDSDTARWMGELASLVERQPGWTLQLVFADNFVTTVEQAIGQLLKRRNAIAHGDLEMRTTPGEVDEIVEVIDALVEQAAA